MLKNSQERYGAIAKIFHWLVGIAIIGMIPFGWYMGDLPSSEPIKFQYYALHKSIGITVLILVWLRFLWRLYTLAPQENKEHALWERRLSKAVHVVLYILMVAMPLSGWLMSSASGFPVSFFGQFTIPDLIGKDQELGKLLNNLHSKIAWGIVAFASLHVLGALKHHLIDKDSTLRRMLPCALFAFLGVMPANADEQIVLQKWNIIPQESQIIFMARWDTSDVEGKFKYFEGDIHFDENDLENSKALISIDMSSFNTGYAERDDEIAGNYWFDTESFKTARFETKSIVKTETGYEALGSLTIKGETKDITLPFTLTPREDGGLQMRSKIILHRLDFNIGLGSWKQTNVIKDEVAVKIDLAVEPDITLK